MLRQQRRKHSWSQAGLGDRIGLGQEHVSNIERGITSPRVDTLLDVARALDLDLVLVPRALVPAVQALEREYRRGAVLGEEDRPLYGFGDDEWPDAGTPASTLPAATKESGEIA